MWGLSPNRLNFMAERKQNPLFFAPFVSSTFRPQREWIDENGHLNMAYFNVIFETALDEALMQLGLTPEYYASGRGTIFIGEAHLKYRREVKLEMPVRVTLQLIDYDEKRMHIYMEMRHANEGWLACTSEVMMLHVDPAERRVAPFPPEILNEIAVMKSAHASLPKPDGLGSQIGIPKSAKSGKVGLH